MRGTPRLALLGLILAPTPLLSGQAGSPRVDEMIPVLCQAMLQQIVSRDPAMLAALKDRRMDHAAVCSCANERFVKDAQITRLANKPVDQLVTETTQQADREALSSYLAMRAVQHIMGCFAEEVDRRLREVVLKVGEPPA